MRRAWTLIETLVVVCIIALVAAIAMPALSQMRKHAKGSITLSRLSQNAKVFHTYSADWQDHLPAPVPPGGPEYRIKSSSLVEDAIFPQYFQSAELWWLAMTDRYYNGSLFDRSWYPSEAEKYGQTGNTAFRYPCVFIAHPHYWNTVTRVTGSSQWGAVKHHAVTYPSKKILLYSDYHRLMRNLEATTHGLDTKSTRMDESRSLIPQAAVDGSASVLMLRDIFPGYENGDGSYHLMEGPAAAHTLDGIRGRDF